MPFEPDHGRDARQARDVAIEPLEGGRPARHRSRGRIAGWRRDAIAADAGVDDRDPGAVLLVQAARQDVGPAIVAVERRGRAVGNRIAETRDDHRVLGRDDIDRVEEIPGGRRERKRVVAFLAAVAAGARRGEIRRGQRLGVPGHRTGRSGDMKADDELAAGQERIGCALHEVQHDRVARRTRAGRNRHARPAALESHLPIRSRRDIAAAALQADEHIVERHGPGAEHIAQAKARCLPHRSGLTIGGTSDRRRGGGGAIPAAPRSGCPGRAGQARFRRPVEHRAVEHRAAALALAAGRRRGRAFGPPGGGPPPGQQVCAQFPALRQEAETPSGRPARKSPRDQVCKLFNSFAATEAKMVKFLADNKSTCGIPPDAITARGPTKTLEIRKQLCDRTRRRHRSEPERHNRRSGHRRRHYREAARPRHLCTLTGKSVAMIEASGGTRRRCDRKLGRHRSAPHWLRPYQADASRPADRLVALVAAVLVVVGARGRRRRRLGAEPCTSCCS